GETCPSREPSARHALAALREGSVVTILSGRVPRVPRRALPDTHPAQDGLAESAAPRAGPRRGAFVSPGLLKPDATPIRPGRASGCQCPVKNRRGVAFCATPPGSHTSPRRPHLAFVESAAIIDVESIPPIAVESEPIVEVSLVAGGVSAAFLPQPAAKDARASAMSARAKSLRIVCTFTSSHAVAPGESPGTTVVFPSASPGLRKKHHWLRAVSGRLIQGAYAIVCIASGRACAAAPPLFTKAKRRLGTNPPLVNRKLPVARAWRTAEHA